MLLFTFLFATRTRSVPDTVIVVCLFYNLSHDISLLHYPPIHAHPLHFLSHVFAVCFVLPRINGNL